MEIETNTSSISGKIQSIITEAKKDLVLVSPYIQLEKSEDEQWDKIKKALRFAKTKPQLQIRVYTRRPAENSKNPIAHLKEFIDDKFKVYLIENLHSKLYCNDDDAIITSMNMYLHSAQNNHEIGVRFDSDDDKPMKKIRNYIYLLHSEAEPYQSDYQIKKSEEMKESEEKSTDSTIQFIEFQVKSKGYKWLKVDTIDGHENKIALDDGYDLELESHYRVKAEKKWTKTQYGYTVQLLNLHDIEKISAFCIACRTPVEEKYKLCYSCKAQQKTAPASITIDYCHQCGKKKSGISEDRPLCTECYNKNKEFAPKEVISEGFCITCGENMPYDQNLIKLRCRSCWSKDRDGLEAGKYCYRCGKEAKVSIEKPICYPCYKKN